MPKMNAPAENSRLDHLDAVRAFALLLGIVYHASLSFAPVFIGWAVMDISTSPLVMSFMLVSHSFRLEVFFLIAGFFGHLAFHRKGAGAFVASRFLRIVVPFVVGWFLLRPLIVSGWIMGNASLRGDVDIGAGLRGGFQSLANLPTGIFVGTHLWFLYYLALITGAVLALRGLGSWSGGAWFGRVGRAADAALGRLASSRWSLVVLVAGTAPVLWFMNHWGVDTPDQTLAVHVPVGLLYGGCFCFGWLLHRKAGLLAEFARVTVARTLIAGASIVATIMLVGIQGDPGHPRYIAAHVAFVVSYAGMMWSLVFLTIGLFQKLCRRPRAVVRYVADSSYWLYLVHLPIVVWLQVAVAELPLHWSIKLVGIIAATVVVSLLTYDLFVRSTFMGQILNGQRRARMIFTTTARRQQGRDSTTSIPLPVKPGQTT